MRRVAGCWPTVGRLSFPAHRERVVPLQVWNGLPACHGAMLSLQDGVGETGVSVAFTVRAMDAGPVLAQERVVVDADVQAPELLHELFRRGTRCSS